MGPITLGYVVVNARSVVTSGHHTIDGVKPPRCGGAAAGQLWQRGRVAHEVRAHGDGDGWARCRDGQSRWGRFGAAGLLLRAPDAQRRPLVLMQHRAAWTHHGDLWGMPAGARDSGETPRQTALREATEEAAVDPGRVRVRGELVEHPGGDAWSFTTVVADVVEPLPVRPNHESVELAWVPEPEVTALDLHPAFAANWPGLQVARTGLVVDAANVVGSRPDGWWRDRAGAAERLLRDVAAAGPGVLTLPQGGFGWVARPVLVLEGVASRAPDVPGVEVVRAPGSGDDTIVDIARTTTDCVVVTADRPLRARLPPHTHPISPSRFLSWLTPHSAGSAG
ncbi:MAG: NUDIX domain-containing protein [Pseudonocardiales bacterium]|nr:NUDIX domain-containing protein [Pseudonocardiales bacterium]MBV9029004.1 NUDIX domain-containing protein [Pseudonocardiales bacterium]